MRKITAADGLSVVSMMSAWEQETFELQQTIVSFGHDLFNVIPFQDSWTAGQVTEHLLKAESGIPGILSGPTLPAERPPDEKTEAIGSIFLDFTTRLKSPEALLPSADPKDQAALMGALIKNRAEIGKVAAVTNLSRRCMLFPFPVLGTLTGFEWIYFAICHSKRHHHQLNNIHRKLTAGQVTEPKQLSADNLTK
jgi:hypothetical protein